MSIAILIPAAGASARMRGTDKLLEPMGNRPLLRHVCKVACAVSNDVLVTLPPDRPKRAAALAGLKVKQVQVAKPSQGMSASFRAIVPYLGADVLGLLILPADMPDLDAHDLTQCIDVFKKDSNAIVRATDPNGVPGHPVMFPSWCFGDLSLLEGDQGARPLLNQYQDKIVFTALPDAHALTDLDTPEAWATWRAKRES